MVQLGDKLYVRSEGRAYMEATVDKIEDGQVYCAVTWAVIIALRFRCAVSDIEQRGDQLVVDYGFAEKPNLNAPRLV